MTEFEIILFVFLVISVLILDRDTSKLKEKIKDLEFKLIRSRKTPPPPGGIKIDKRTITYLELLQLVKEGKQPRTIKVNISPLWKSEFTWNDLYGYVNEGYAKLPLCLSNTYDDIKLAERKCIEVIET